MGNLADEQPVVRVETWHQVVPQSALRSRMLNEPNRFLGMTVRQRLKLSDDARPKKKKNGEKRVAFDYIKSPHFRAVRADGAIGGVTPTGQIHVAFYSERNPIPRRVTFAVEDSGKLGEEVSRETREAIVREMDFDLFLSLSVAKSVHEWLGTRIAELEARDQKKKV